MGGVEALNLTRLQETRLMPDRVADGLREAIIRGQIQPGAHLREATIAQQLGVSTVPVREAFHQLEREGLVYTVPRHGRYVRDFTERETRDLYRVRESLDELAYDMIAEGGHLSPAADEQLQRDIDEVSAAIASRDLYRIAELDLRFHDHIHDLTGSEVLQGMWRTLRMRLHVLYHWRLDTMPESELGNTVAIHTAVLNELRNRSTQGGQNHGSR